MARKREDTSLIRWRGDLSWWDTVLREGDDPGATPYARNWRAEGREYWEVLARAEPHGPHKQVKRWINEPGAEAEAKAMLEVEVIKWRLTQG